MSGKEHIVLGVGSGITAGLCLLGNGTLETTGFAAFTVCSVLGSIAVDIDEPESYMGQCFPFISKLIKKFFGHRTLTHDLLLHLILLGVAIHFKSVFGLAYLLGAFGHLLLDSTTKLGIPLSIFLRFILKKLKKFEKLQELLGHFSLIPFKKIRCSGGTAWSWTITWITTILVVRAIYITLGGF